MSAGRSPCAAASSRFTSSQEGPTGRASYAEHPRGHDRGRQAGTAPAPPFRVPEERPEGRCIGLDGDAGIALIPNLPGQQLIDLGDGQRIQPQPGLVDPREELGDRPASVLDGARRQPPLLEHVVGELGDVLGVRPRGRGRGLQTAQESEPSSGMAGEPEPCAVGPSASAAVGLAIGPAVGLGLDLGSGDEFAGSIGQAQGLGDDEDVDGDVP